MKITFNNIVYQYEKVGNDILLLTSDIRSIYASSKIFKMKDLNQDIFNSSLGSLIYIGDIEKLHNNIIKNQVKYLKKTNNLDKDNSNTIDGILYKIINIINCIINKKTIVEPVKTLSEFLKIKNQNSFVGVKIKNKIKKRADNNRKLSKSSKVNSKKIEIKYNVYELFNKKYNTNITKNNINKYIGNLDNIDLISVKKLTDELHEFGIRKGVIKDILIKNNICHHVKINSRLNILESDKEYIDKGLFKVYVDRFHVVRNSITVNGAIFIIMLLVKEQALKIC